MLTFPEGYFQDEEREGFLVDMTMKTVWAAELEVLNEVAVVCARHDLQWYAAYGTLLGAVRHQGFVPWDDDMDIWVKREDYRQLIQYLPDELPEGYIVHAPRERAGYPEYQVYVDNADFISIEPQRLERFHGCPFYVGIDIYPLDDLPAGQAEREMQRRIFATTLMLQQVEYESKASMRQQMECETKISAQTQNGMHGSADEGDVLYKQSGGNQGTVMKEALEKTAALLEALKDQYGIVISRKLLKDSERTELLRQLWRTAEQMPRLGKSNKSSQITMYLDYLKFEKVYERAWFDEVTYLPFEGFDVPVPVGFDEVLKVVYGDYMIPARGAMHDYPCYKRQLEELRKIVAERTGNKGY